jgi:hypothetical protein
MVKTKYNREADALLLEFSDKPIDVAEERGPFIFHYAADGELVLVEVFDAHEFILRAMESVFEGAPATKAVS